MFWEQVNGSVEVEENIERLLILDNLNGRVDRRDE